MSNILQVTQDNFDEIVHHNPLVVIAFSAIWCVPCHSFSQVLAKLAPSYAEFVFGVIDIDQQPELAKEFSIQAVPSVMILRNQAIVFAHSGEIDIQTFKDLLQQTQNL